MNKQRNMKAVGAPQVKKAPSNRSSLGLKKHDNTTSTTNAPSVLSGKCKQCGCINAAYYDIESSNIYLLCNSFDSKGALCNSGAKVRLKPTELFWKSV
jgi:hypothetical protein